MGLLNPERVRVVQGDAVVVRVSWQGFAERKEIRAEAELEG